MPNWCTNSVTITCISGKQAKKIKRLLTKENSITFDRYKIGKNIDFTLLSFLDNIFKIIKKDNELEKYNDFLVKSYKTIGKIKQLRDKNINIKYNFNFGKCTKENLDEIINSIKTINNEVDKCIEENKHQLVEDSIKVDKYGEYGDDDFLLCKKFIHSNCIHDYRKSLDTDNRFATDILEIDDPYWDYVYKSGSKWEPEIIGMSRDKNKLYFELESAWSPVLEFFRYFSYLYGIKVSIGFIEEGMMFCGYYEYEDGECISENDYSGECSIDLYYMYSRLMDDSDIFYDQMEYFKDLIECEAEDVLEYYYDGYKIKRKEAKRILKNMCTFEEINKIILDELYPKKKMRFIKVKRIK